MWNILLAEDENLIRANIVQLLHQYLPDFAHVAEAASGEEAIALLRREEPDILVTDIQMPGKSGLELIRYAKQCYPDLPCIILTGYQEFQWVKEALQLGSLDYLLKPVSHNEFIASLHKAAKLREKSEAYASLYPLVELEPFFIKAIEGDEEDIRQFADKAKAQMLSLDDGQPKIVLAVDDTVSRQRLYEAVRKKKGIVFCAGPHLFAAMIAVQPNAGQQRLRKEMQALAADLGADGERLPAIGFSGCFSRWEEAPLRYHEAYRNYEPRFYLGSQWIAGPIDASDYAPKSSCMNTAADPFLERLESAFVQGAVDEAERIILDWFKEASRERWRMAEVHAVCARGMRRLLGSLSNDQLELLGLQTWHAAQWVAKRRTADTLREDLLTFFRDIGARTQHYAGNVQSLIAKVQAMIERDYRAPELSIVHIASELHVSSSHLSAVFKKKTGKPFTRYVTDLRLDKARQLLEEDRLKAYEVAAAIGYRNEKAFSRAFRRQYGVSPQNYKKRSGLR